jgi:hypothetical protein
MHPFFSEQPIVQNGEVPTSNLNLIVRDYFRRYYDSESHAHLLHAAYVAAFDSQSSIDPCATVRASETLPLQLPSPREIVVESFSFFHDEAQCNALADQYFKSLGELVTEPPVAAKPDTTLSVAKEPKVGFIGIDHPFWK